MMLSSKIRTSRRRALGFAVLGLVTFFYQPARALQLPVRPDFEFGSEHRASPLYLWQNDPETLGYFQIPFNGVTQLCLTSTLGTAVLNEYAYRKPISTKTSFAGVDTHQLQLRLVRECSASPTEGTDFLSLSECSLNYFESIHLVRNTLYFQNENRISIDQRPPTPEDIKSALDSRNQVIASIAYAALDPESNRWKEATSHAVNVFGFERISPSLIKLWITNPTRNYQADGTKVLFDEVYLNYRAPSEVPLAGDLAPWEWSGRLISRPQRRAFLVGLTVLTPKPNITWDSL